MDVQGIIADWLEEHAFDGLVNPDGECGCELGNLVDCDGPCLTCLPGYKGPDPSGEFDFMIYHNHDDREAARAEAIKE